MSEIENFETYAKLLDEEAKKLKLFNEWEKEGEFGDATDLAEAYITALETVLKSIGVKDAYKDAWHNFCLCLEFKPFNNRYFKKKSHRREDLLSNKDLEVVIGLGYDEELDYDEEDKPELVLWYQNDSNFTDFNLFNPKYWREALKDIFYLYKITAQKQQTNLKSFSSK